MANQEKAGDAVVAKAAARTNAMTWPRAKPASVARAARSPPMVEPRPQTAHPRARASTRARPRTRDRVSLFRIGPRSLVANSDAETSISEGTARVVLAASTHTNALAVAGETIPWHIAATYD